MSTTYTYTKPNNLMNLPSNISRITGGPLDNSSMFASIDDFEYYISKGQKEGLTLTDKFQEYVDGEERGYIAEFFKPYVGQIVSVIDIKDGNRLKVFQITELNDTAKIWKYQQMATLLNVVYDDAGNLSVVNSDAIIFNSNDVEVKHLTIDDPIADNSIISIGNTSSDIAINTNSYIFGNGFYENDFGPNKEVLSTDIYKIFKDDEITLSVDILATRRWVDNKKVDRINENYELSNYTLGEYLELLTTKIGGTLIR